MDDKTMLELAAKAAGLGLPTKDDTDEIGRNYSPALGLWARHSWGFSWWNPLTDDGDALRLAVKLELVVRCYSASIIVDGCGENWIEENDMTDRNVATRRAIVRAAAEIGKGMGVGE